MNKSLAPSFFLLAALTIISFHIMADNTYKFKVKGQKDDVTLVEKFKEDWKERVKISYKFSSHCNYNFLLRGGRAIKYNCGCKGKEDGFCTSTCSDQTLHAQDCPASGIFESTFSVRRPRDPEDVNPLPSVYRPPYVEQHIRPMVIPLNHLIHPLVAHFNRYREGSVSSMPSDDVLDRTLHRLQAAALLPNDDHFLVPVGHMRAQRFVSTSDPIADVTVLIPPAALANSPESDILPLAHITDPVFIFNEQGIREAIEFNARFLQMPSAVYRGPFRQGRFYPPEDEAEAGALPFIITPGRYRINLTTGEFHLIVTVQGRPPIEITGSISPTNELETEPDAGGVHESQMADALQSAVCDNCGSVAASLAYMFYRMGKDGKK